MKKKKNSFFYAAFWPNKNLLLLGVSTIVSAQNKHLIGQAPALCRAPFLARDHGARSFRFTLARESEGGRKERRCCPSAIVANERKIQHASVAFEACCCCRSGGCCAKLAGVLPARGAVPPTEQGRGGAYPFRSSQVWSRADRGIARGGHREWNRVPVLEGGSVSVLCDLPPRQLRKCS